jgi:hypothetical protein
MTARRIPIDADAIDLEDRADHLSKVVGLLSVYVAVILDDTAQNVPSGLDLRDVEGLLAALVSDLTGTIHHAAERIAGRVDEFAAQTCGSPRVRWRLGRPRHHGRR